MRLLRPIHVGLQCCQSRKDGRESLLRRYTVRRHLVLLLVGARKLEGGFEAEGTVADVGEDFIRSDSQCEASK